MTINILVSFSLLALVVTARPIPDAAEPIRKSLEVRHAIQAIFASRTGRHPTLWAHSDNDDDVHISLTSIEEQSAFLSSLQDLDAVKALIPLNLEGAPSEDEKQLYDILKDLKDSGSSLFDLDGGERPLSQDATSGVAAADASTDADVERTTGIFQHTLSTGFAELYSSPPLIVMAVSCIAALLSLLCIGAGLYALHHFEPFVLQWDLARIIFPRLERHVRLDGPDEHPISGSALQPEQRRLLKDDALLPLPIGVEEKLDEITEKAPIEPDADDSDDDGEMDGKFQDAQEHSLLFLEAGLAPQCQPERDVPQIVIEDHADPDLLPLPEAPSNRSSPFATFATPLWTPLRTPLDSPTCSLSGRVPQMREVNTAAPAPAPKPLWSLRAADAPVLGLSGAFTPTSLSRTASPIRQLPGALFPDDAPELNMVEIPRPRQRTPRQPLDIAFALQLRPGLGLGADSAWIVRFLMAMFGWMTVLIGAGRQESNVRRALTG